ncbi:GNAT family N-acetyltransferase [Salipaludibacillus aurantiacus]|uniref:N-acetyltransferase domain-containing protein n=1 Tax=Salipaludibacillus aurantiacus TaxID=1601833 RepID=A0A1H9RSX0_9BACI|nr:GNAT family N-acetyltransferase [Salipaludibacillus aurantiacus]SER75233.1 hypothetical protein SAMN05518684_103292 [Salipaludibacillus aurantiacus]
MKFTRYDSASLILNRAEDFLLKKEVTHNLPLGILRQFSKEEERSPDYSKDIFMAAGENDKREVEVVMVRTPPRNLIICGTGSGVEKAARWLAEEGTELPGVVGCSNTAKAFSEEWAKLTSCRVEQAMKQKIYQLQELKSFQRNPGRLTYATEDDIALVLAWTKEFEEEALGITEHPNLEETVRREIRNNQVYFWRDEHCTPVSMAKKGRELKNGVVVNFVYTPEEYQRKGYATSCVGALSERLLNEGFRFCSLNTDAENPASNSIYMKIGYESVGDAAEYKFIYN